MEGGALALVVVRCQIGVVLVEATAARLGRHQFVHVAGPIHAGEAGRWAERTATTTTGTVIIILDVRMFLFIKEW